MPVDPVLLASFASQRITHRVYNNTTSLLIRGDLVSNIAFIEDKTVGFTMSVGLADKDTVLDFPVIGVISADIASGAFGEVTSYGVVRADTSTFDLGDIVILGNDGHLLKYTDVLQPGFTGIVQTVGHVVKAAVKGQLFITIAAAPRTVPEIIGGTGSPTGDAGGDLDGDYPDPTVIAVHSGATRLTIGTIEDGDIIRRSGTELEGQVIQDFDELVSVSENDDFPGYLNQKLAAGPGLSSAVAQPSGDETLNISVDFDAVTSTRSLLNFIDGGPVEGFISGAEYTEDGPGAYPTIATWYTDATHTKKIVEQTVVYNSNFTFATSVWELYATDGITIVRTVTDTFSYLDSLRVNRVRTIS